jgi:hypothetical protein
MATKKPKNALNRKKNTPGYKTPSKKILIGLFVLFLRP